MEELLMQVSSTSHPTPPVKSPAPEQPPQRHAQEAAPKPAHVNHPSHHHHHHQGRHVDKTA
ncbi:MAG TPA: hypothetical protein VEU06_11995 [Micropepsaceae bacterium]|nr:hypothetical protein [Micropepsaceae bacterium]